MRKFFIIALLAQYLSAQDGLCDKLYTYYLDIRETNNCTQIREASTLYKQLVKHKCLLDGLDIDMGEYLIDEDKKCKGEDNENK
jgi:hypothetical protein